MPQQKSYLQITIALLLIAVFTINGGFQYSAEALNDPVKMDICDHTDSETECDKKEKGETDDVIEPEPKVSDLFSISSADKYLLTLLNPASSHLEIPTPPPERHL